MSAVIVESETWTPPLPTIGRRDGGSWAAMLGAFVLAVAPAIFWPGDVSWINDEPRLIAAAWHANAAHTLAVGGLYGNFGIRYGPLATQIYQALLLITHDPVTLAVLRSLLCAGVTAFSLLWLARTLRLSPWFGVAACLAPQVWQFQRVVWDASFAIPLGSLALAAYAAFHESRRERDLLVALGATLVLPFIHPQDLPLFVAIAGALGWGARRELRLHWKGVVLVLGAVLALNGVYVVEALWGLAHRLGGAVAAGYPAGVAHGRAALAPFLGGNLLSDYKFTGAVTTSEAAFSFATMAGWLSRIVYPLGWAGIGLTAWRAFAARRTATAEAGVETRAGVERIILTTLALQAVLFGVMRVPAEPQYFFGSFVVQALLPWLAVEALRPRVFGICLTAVYGGAVCFVTFYGMISIHRHGYATQPPLITLANQVEVARGLNRFSDPSVVTDAAMYQQYPQALRALRLLLPPEPGLERAAGRRLWIRATPGSLGRVELVQLPDGEAAPGATPMEVTPLPAGWQPAG